MPLEKKQHLTSTRDNMDRYLSAYQLDRDPFSDAGMTGLFFPGGGRKKIVGELLHYTRYANSPVLLIAGVGFGKTFILNEFSSSVESDTDIAIIDVEIMMGETQLLEEIIQQFGQTARKDSMLFSQLVEWIREQSVRKREVIICFDNAHHLTAEFLQPFFELNVDETLSLKLVFSGELETKRVLESLVEHNYMLLNTIEVRSFKIPHVSSYAEYRLTAAGYQGALPLSEMQIQAATMRSRGNVRQLNDLLRDMLIAGSENQKQNRFQYPASNLVIAFFISAVIVYFGLRSLDSGEIDVVAPISLEKVTPEVAVTNTPKPIDNLNDRLKEVKEDLVLEDKSASLSVGKTLESNTKIVDDKSSTASVVLASNPPNGDIESRVADSGEGINGSDESELLKESSDSVVERAIDVQNEVIVDKGLVSENALNDTGDLDPISIPKNNDSEGAAEISVVQQPRHLAVHQRLKAWSDTGYALQVFGTHNAQRARKLVEQYFGEADLLFYETRHNGKPWYVVISGPYSGRQSAQQSIKGLPDSLQRLRPWPRNIASIKSDIDRYKLLISDGRE